MAKKKLIDISLLSTFLDNLKGLFATKNELDQKQSLLQSGENIKTVNGQSIVGSGNINIMKSFYVNMEDGCLYDRG